MSSELISSIKQYEKAFGLELSEEALSGLDRYYTIVQENNPLLHLVGPCSAEEFSVRHVLESLAMLEFLPDGAAFADVGAGAGLPSIPCLIARDDLKGFLIESKVKKAGFLRAAVAKCGLDTRATVIEKQFSETPRPDVSYVTCRALDRFTQNLPRLIKWSGKNTLLFYGGPRLADELRKLNVKFEERIMPMSEQRYLFVAKR